MFISGITYILYQVSRDTASSLSWHWRGRDLLFGIHRQPVASTAIFQVAATAEHTAFCDWRFLGRRVKSVTAVALAAILGTEVLVVLTEIGTCLVGHLATCCGRTVEGSGPVAFGLAPDQDEVSGSRRLFRPAPGSVGVHVELQSAAGAAVLELIAGTLHAAVLNGSTLAGFGQKAAAVAFAAKLSTKVLVALAEFTTSLVGHLVTGGSLLGEGSRILTLRPASN